MAHDAGADRILHSRLFPTGIFQAGKGVDLIATLSTADRLSFEVCQPKFNP